MLKISDKCYNKNVDPVLNYIREFFVSFCPQRGGLPEANPHGESNWVNQTVPLS